MDLTLDDTMIQAIDDETLLELEETGKQSTLDGKRRLEMLREEKRLREYLNEVWYDDKFDNLDR